MLLEWFALSRGRGMGGGGVEAEAEVVVEAGVTEHHRGVEGGADVGEMWV